MVVNAYQMDILDSHVNVHLVSAVNGAKIKMFVPANRVKTVVFVLVQVVVPMFVSVVVVSKDQLANSVSIRGNAFNISEDGDIF